MCCCTQLALSRHMFFQTVSKGHTYQTPHPVHTNKDVSERCADGCGDLTPSLIFYFARKKRKTLGIVSFIIFLPKSASALICIHNSDKVDRCHTFKIQVRFLCCIFFFYSKGKSFWKKKFPLVSHHPAVGRNPISPALQSHGGLVSLSILRKITSS